MSLFLKFLGLSQSYRADLGPKFVKIHRAGVVTLSCVTLEDVPQAGGIEASEINTDCIFQDCRSGLPPRAQVLTDQEGLSVFQIVHF